MPVKLILKNSTVKDKAPLPADIDVGELAVNLNDQSPAIYGKDSAGNIVKLAGAGSVSTPAASETVAGIAEIATQAEVDAGTDDERFITPVKLAATPFASKWDRTGTAVSPKTTGDTVQISAGTAALPGLTPVGDPNTGVWSPGADQLAVSTNGAERIRIDAAGDLLVGGSALASAKASIAANGKITSIVDASINNVTVGHGAGTAAASNTAVGNYALQANTTGFNSIAIGWRALFSNTTGNSNNAIGLQALYSNIAGANNNAVGFHALFSNTTGNNNNAFGNQALYSNTTGNHNNAIGIKTLYSNTAGYGNSAFNSEALRSNTTGNNNNAFGNQALYSNTTGNGNTAAGSQALYFNITGTGNSAVGGEALNFNTTGVHNSAVGSQALHRNGSVIATDLVLGTSYTILYVGKPGTETDFTLVGAANNTVGTVFTATGPGTGTGIAANNDVVVSSNTALGFQAGFLNSIGTNNTFIGNSAAGATPESSNTITLGDTAITALRCQVTTITALSDERDKADIIDLDAGLDFINTLRPVSFTWNTRDGAKVGIKDAGFIAQELLSAQEDTGVTIPNLVSQANPDRLEAGYGTLIPVLVNAVQELTVMVKDLQSEIATLKGVH